jgi:clumping factor A
VTDGAEDADHDGRIDAGERDPNDPADDGLVVDTDGDGLSDGRGGLPRHRPERRRQRRRRRPRRRRAQPVANDSDGDGLINALDPDSDDDGLFDGTELGVTAPDPGTDGRAGNFIPDADPATTTNPLDPDTDDGGVSDGAEDGNHDGAIDPGERNPRNPADDAT